MLYCKTCGGELPEGAKFCGKCGTPVDLSESDVPQTDLTPEEAPAQEAVISEELPAQEIGVTQESTDQIPLHQDTLVTSPQQTLVAEAEEPILHGKKTGLRFIAIAAVAVLILALVVFGVVKLLGSTGGGNAFVYTTDDQELMYLKKLSAKTEGLEITDEEVQSVFFSPDNKLIYYFEKSHSGSCDLFMIKRSKIGKDSPVKIDSNVAPYFLRTLNSGDLLYATISKDSTYRLYLYDGKESHKLAKNVDKAYECLVDQAQKYVYYTESKDSYGYSLYRTELKKNGKTEKLLDEFSSCYTPYDADTLVYSVFDGDKQDAPMGDDFSYDVYTAKSGEKGKKLLSDVVNLLDVQVDGKQVTIYYLSTEDASMPLYDLVTDRMLREDQTMHEPRYDDYRTYNGFWMVTDWDAYHKARDAWNVVQQRNNLRDSLQKQSFENVLYTLHCYKNGASSVVAEHLDHYPAVSGEDGFFIYAKQANELSPVCDLSDLYYSNDIYDFIGGQRDLTWYQLINGKESELDLDEDGYVYNGYLLNGKDVLLQIGTEDDIGTTINHYTMSSNALTLKGKVLDADDSSCCKISLKDGSEALLILSDRDYNNSGTSCEFHMFRDGKLVPVADDACAVQYVSKSDTMYLFDDFENRDGTQEASFYIIKGGKKQLISHDVDMHAVHFLNDGTIAFLCDDDLLYYNGKKAEVIARDVTNFWASNELYGKLIYAEYEDLNNSWRN